MYAFHTSRSQAKLFSTEYAIGDPFGYGKKNDVGAVLGAVAGPIVSGLFGQESSNQQQQAAQQAANTSGAATAQALELQRQMYEQQRADQAPWRQQGGESLNMLARYMGAPSAIDADAYLRANPDLMAAFSTGKTPEEARQSALKHYQDIGRFEGRQGLGEGFGSLMKPFTMQDYQQDPGYNFRLSEGLKSIERGAAARGGLMSGATMKGLQRYGQDAASNEYQNAFNRYQSNQQNQYNRLAGLSGTGQTASNALAQAGGNYAGNAGNLIMGNAVNQGNAQLAAGQARASSYGGLGSALGQNSLAGGNSAPSSYTNFDTGWAPYQSGVGAGYIDPYYGDGNGSGF